MTNYDNESRLYYDKLSIGEKIVYKSKEKKPKELIWSYKAVEIKNQLIFFERYYKINGNWVLIEEWEQNTFNGYQEQKYVRANSTFLDYLV